MSKLVSSWRNDGSTEKKFKKRKREAEAKRIESSQEPRGRRER